MILEDLVALTRRQLIPIREDELETLERDGPRALNYMMSRGLGRVRARAKALLRTLVFLVFASYLLRWSGAGLLAFVVYGAVLTVAVDVMRQWLAARWLFYSHSRAHRAEDVLVVGRCVESGSTRRPPPSPRRSVVMTLGPAIACTVIGLPLVWFTLRNLGWASWDTVFANFFLPLCMLFMGIWRLVRGFLAIQFAKGSSVGTRDLFLDSDDALDIYAIALLLGLLLGAFGAGAMAWVAYLVVIIRLAWLGMIWRQQRQSLALLQQRIRRTHPHAPGTVSDWSDEAATDDWR